METKPGDLEGLAQTSVSALEADKKAADTKTEQKEDTAPKATDPSPQVADVPDPDEDDLDDLDGT